MTTIQVTSPSKVSAVIRILISLPLILIGMMHLTGAAPMLPILKGAGIPFPELNAIFAPIMQVGAGLLLASGFYARLGALIAGGAMVVATYTHIVHDWTDEPPIALALAIFAGSVWVVARGAGAWSLDRKECTKGIA